ncbi:hypothetical protein VNI00_008892 [Paramarasmius palmivorus]|uniref:Uncharacterized protein n=1 Tax=Paramarasmius palmivorus TaxID=297713 RepID=A0AAW0CRN2_9AGAR
MEKPAVLGSSNAANSQVMQELFADADLQRIAGLGSGIFQSTCPKLYAIYAQNKKHLQSHDPALRWPWANSIFAATTFNFGPRTVSFPHLDFNNKPDGFCTITAMTTNDKSFDYTRGGHLILWDLGVVVEFPPGTTVLIPSAIFRHSNVAIGKHERRYSFTQYTAGSLFRFVERGFQTEESFWASLDDDERIAEMANDANRWSQAVRNFEKL